MRAVALQVVALLVLAAFVLAGCFDDWSGCASDCISVNDGGPVIKGSGTAKTESRTVAPFTAIRMEIGGRAEIERTPGSSPGAAASLAVTADDNLLGLLTTEVKDGTLILGTEKGKSLAGKMPVYKITVADLRSLELKGSGEADAGKLDSNALSVAVAGSSAAKLAGRADELTIAVSGSAACNAGALTAKRATVSVSGSGDVTVNASEALDAKVSGSGSVHYLGAPKLTKAVSGSGSITGSAN
jgi:Putative auto-transporter adhesin, head GIN domain